MKNSRLALIFAASSTCLGAFFYVGCSTCPPSQPDTGAAGPMGPRTETATARPAWRRGDDAPGPAGSRKTIRVDARFDEELRASPLAPRLEGLLQRAKRDAAFSYALARALQDCSRLSLEEEAYLEKADSLQHGRAFEIEQAGALHEKQRWCEGIEDSAQIRYRLIDRAAAAGMVEAQIAFRAIAADFIASDAAMRHNDAMRQYKRRVLEYTYAAAGSGSPEALFDAYEVTSSGLFAPRNARLAYTYLYAYSKARPSPRTAHLLAIESRHLSAADLAGARAAAEKILAGSAGLAGKGARR